MGLALVAALALTALGSGGTPWASGPSPGRISTGWLNVALTLAVLAGLLLVAFLAYTVWPRQVGRRKRDLPVYEDFRLLLWSDRLVLFLFFAAVVGGIVAILLVGGRRVHTHEIRPSPSVPPAGSIRPATPESQTGSGASIEWPLLGGGLAAIALAGTIAVVRARRRRGTLATAASAPPTLLAALDESLDDLEQDPDARRAVIRAYARMERSLAESGVPRRPAEAPFEYVDRVLRELRAGDREVRQLTDLFALAKFSQHRIGPSMKDRAISALTTLRAQLSGSA